MKEKLYVIFILITFLSAIGCASTNESKVEKSSTVKPAIFFQSIKSGDAAEVERLLNKGADINAKDMEGDSALVGAVYSGSTEVAKLLLDAGADINAGNNNGFKALDIAEREGQGHIADYLIAEGGE